MLAYCGIYCGDCLGYTGVIADAAKDFLAHSCVKNLRAIKKMGLDAWIRRGKRHCYWDKEDD